MTSSGSASNPLDQSVQYLPRVPFEIAVFSSSDVVARSLRTVLEYSGYAVRLGHPERGDAEMAVASGADAIIIIAATPRLPAAELCRRLHGDVRFDPTTPILVLVAADCTRTERLEVLAAGAWDASSEPLDGEILLLKLQRLMRMRRAVGRLSALSLVDQTSGLYSWGGLVRRSLELAALARRRREPIAVIALIEPGRVATGRQDQPRRRGDRERIGLIFRETMRSTDAVGCVGDPFGYMCIALNADAAGASSILARLRGVLDDRIALPTSLGQIRAGYCTAARLTAAPTEAMTMMRRAIHRAMAAAPGGTIGECV
jgi:DNA-binding response OmpR family regulator